MHRSELLKKLESYHPVNQDDRHSLERIRAFVLHQPECFSRSLAIGHVTGSAWLLDPSLKRVLLTHHRKLNRWLQLGGHSDGNPNPLEVALREANEESGIQEIEVLSEEIFDVDVHLIPARPGEPAHDHHDVRFLLRAKSADFAVSEESHDLAWVSVEELPRYTTEASMLRMHQKWQAWLNGSLSALASPNP